MTTTKRVTIDVGDLDLPTRHLSGGFTGLGWTTEQHNAIIDAGLRAAEAARRAPTLVSHTETIARLLDICATLDEEARSAGQIEGRLGTDFIRHVIHGGTMDTYTDNQPKVVRDRDGDVWKRNDDGSYVCEIADATIPTYARLDDAFGPLRDLATA